MLNPDISTYAASYKDRDGFIFKHRGNFYRCINASYSNNYQLLMQSGLYTQLTQKKWLVPHREITGDPELNGTDTIIILPQQIQFISYAYEWSFAMWQDAALLTLNIAKEAVEKGIRFLVYKTDTSVLIEGYSNFINSL